MIKAEDTRTLRQQVQQWRDDHQEIVLVPTLGNLHAGHLALVERARDLGDRVVVSIFVNPTQFVQGEDFADYPRTLDEDLQQLQTYEVDLIYLPDLQAIYPDNDVEGVQVAVPALDGRFCGASRPGHFTGVATVVTKLLNLVQPHKAVFGEKDYQQLLVIRKLVKDLHIPVEIIDHPTVREADGLAMSSRNRYLTGDERERAPLIYANLCRVRDRILAGERDFRELEQSARASLEDAGLRVDYFSVASATDLSEPAGKQLIILAAAWLGRARLIDNLRVSA
ncbi:MAG: pantoate--beta-alanine ligase [Gammaproteobacteria bacterium]|nr:pantoate--beta-alanine ligase [Gammaproteobacteria bacterium]